MAVGRLFYSQCTSSYLDESGNPDNPEDEYFVLGGAAIFERKTYFISRDLDAIQTKYFPGIPPVEFHTSPMEAGRGFWRNVPWGTRQSILQDIAQLIASVTDQRVVLFCAAIQKTDQLYGERAVEKATEQVCERFDTYLSRWFHERNVPERGLIVFAESHFTSRSKLWVRGFREYGTQWGILNNLSDIPYFASTRDTRLLQLADFISHTVFRLYEKQDAELIKVFLDRFDQKDGILHGLVHVTRSRRTCDCPACWSRRTPYSFGPMI